MSNLGVVSLVAAQNVAGRAITNTHGHRRVRSIVNNSKGTGSQVQIQYTHVELIISVQSDSVRANGSYY